MPLDDAPCVRGCSFIILCLPVATAQSAVSQHADLKNSDTKQTAVDVISRSAGRSFSASLTVSNCSIRRRRRCTSSLNTPPRASCTRSCSGTATLMRSEPPRKYARLVAWFGFPVPSVAQHGMMVLGFNVAAPTDSKQHQAIANLLHLHMLLACGGS